RQGFGSVGTVCTIAGLCAVCGAGALASVWWNNEVTAGVTTGMGLLLLVVTRSFGHSECALLLRRLHGFAGSLVSFERGELASEPLCSRFHGSRKFEDAWQSLVVFAERFDLSTLHFNVNAPMLGEVFHAQWQRRDRP